MNVNLRSKKSRKNDNTLFIWNFKIILFSCIFLFFNSCSRDNSIIEGNEENRTLPEIMRSDAINQGDNLYAVKAPPFSEDIFPCSGCHADEEPNPNRRQLVDMHDDIDAIFSHDRENRWCLDCHSIDTRDSLKLASGKLIGFDESYKLCGQCHGDKLRDWKVGVHGKRTGEWNGKKQYLLCVHCHNPHSPKFKAIKPLPPPVQQKDIQL